MKWLDGITNSMDMKFEQTPGDSEGQESRACCHPWGCKELDMNEWLNSNDKEAPREIPGSGTDLCVASQQHYWPGFRCHTAAAKSCQSCPTLYDPIDGSPPGSCPWDSPGKNTGVGCHFLLQCMKVKSEREVTQSCPTLSDPMDCSLTGSSVHGIFQARVLEWVPNAKL